VVVVPGDSTPDRGGTDYIAGLEYRFSPEWKVASAGQWSPDTNQIQRSSLALRYRRDSRRLDLSYRYRRDLQFDEFGAPLSVEQADLSGVTPVWGGWSLLGRWRYSLAEERTLESLGGVEYRTCCWALRAAGRRYQYSFDTVAQEPEYTTGVYAQLELTGLARIGAGFQALLPTLGDESAEE